MLSVWLKVEMKGIYVHVYGSSRLKRCKKRISIRNVIYYASKGDAVDEKSRLRRERERERERERGSD
jgi:hypothetical protein